jgi:hypothetical protein
MSASRRSDTSAQLSKMMLLRWGKPPPVSDALRSEGSASSHLKSSNSSRQGWRSRSSATGEMSLPHQNSILLTPGAQLQHLSGHIFCFQVYLSAKMLRQMFDSLSAAAKSNPTFGVHGQIRAAATQLEAQILQRAALVHDLHDLGEGEADAFTQPQCLDGGSDAAGEWANPGTRHVGHRDMFHLGLQQNKVQCAACGRIRLFCLELEICFQQTRTGGQQILEMIECKI